MTKRTHARTRFDAPPRHPREAAEERIVAQLAERMRANPRIGRVLEKLAGVFLIGFGIKLAISK